MRIFSVFEKLFTPYALIALNLAIILSALLAGGGEYFAESGLAHGIAILFVALIIVRIFSDYAFSDYILRGFLRIQMAFFLFLGLVHVYEYLGLDVFMFNAEVVELSVMGSYLLWILGILLALEFVFRIYSQKSAMFTVILYTLLIGCFSVLVFASLSPVVAKSLPEWFPLIILSGIVGFGVISILAMVKIREIMPVFADYSRYAIPATILVILAAFSEYFESTSYLLTFGISHTHVLYFAHFFVYIALSLLLIGFGKLKKPKGIYAEM